MKKLNRRICFEQLEDRSMMAGGLEATYPVIPPALSSQVQVNNLYMASDRILPGASDVVLSQFSLGTVGRTFAQIVSNKTQFAILPGPGESLAGNVENMILRVDADGKASNGCEKTIAYGQPSWEAGGMVVFTANTSLWIRNTPMKAEVVATRFSPYLSGESISVELAGVFGLRDLGGKEIGADAINYGGADTVVHTMQNHSYQIFQNEGKPFQSTSTSENWKLLDFNGWGNNASLKIVTAVVNNPGNLVPNSLLLVQDNNWDGNGEAFYAGSSIVMQNASTGLVTFNLNSGATNSAHFWVTGLTATRALSDNTFSMTLNSAIATDNATGYWLKGTMQNGQGEGQMQIWTKPATTFALVEKPSLVIFSGDLRPDVYVEQTKVTAGQEVMIAEFDAKNTDTVPVTINSFMLTPKVGDVRNFSSYTLWAYDSTGYKAIVGSGILVDKNILMLTSATIPVETSVHYEVTATATPITALGQQLQVRMTPSRFAATNGTQLDAVKKVFFSLGENPWFTFDDIGLG